MASNNNAVNKISKLHDEFQFLYETDDWFKKVDAFLADLIDNESLLDACVAVNLGLTVYKLPFVPSKLINYNRWMTWSKSYALDNLPLIYATAAKIKITK